MAHFRGRPRFEWGEDGRIMTLLNRFAFVDDAEIIWAVPAQTRVNGASIPKFAWPLIGSPFVGRYRKASVIHDWYCDIRTRHWKTTHRMFYEAMRCSKVSAAKARIMYAAVYYAGPRWNDSPRFNSELAMPVSKDQFHVEQFTSDTQPSDGDDLVVWERRDKDPIAFTAMCDRFAENCSTPAEVEAMIDAQMGATE
ncbi:MAG: DUF1353 domain-containing protein [Parasphingorhabdus sp.]|uniref:DUF1353 domain-containing protein n=1 Tax=Parasphingorhabdus sp. TaxID=2709688 RepID=UPI003299A0C1